MKFVLEFDVSGPSFTEEVPGMIEGYALSVHLKEVASRLDGHFMEAGEKGAIMDIKGERKIGSWSITD